jgi:polyisoprenoid-binding protein YceI
MKKTLISLFTLALAGQLNAQSPGKWVLDPAHSQVMFTVSHLVIAEVTGQFKTFNANVTAGKPDFTDAEIQFTVDIASINTDNEMRDNHLKSDDFFNAEKFPKMTFTGKGLKKVSGNKYKLSGNLTIRDVTRPVTLDVVYAGTVKDPWGNTKAGFKVKGVINRFDYNLKWNNLTEAGGAVVGADVELTVNLELAAQK